MFKLFIMLNLGSDSSPYQCAPLLLFYFWRKGQKYEEPSNHNVRRNDRELHIVSLYGLTNSKGKDFVQVSGENNIGETVARIPINIPWEASIFFWWKMSFRSKTSILILELSNKLPCLGVPNSRINLFPVLHAGTTKRKGINIATPNMPASKIMDLLDAYEDEYDGVIVDPQCLPASSNSFASILQSSLSYWKLQGKKGVWLKILEDQAELIPIALKEGFKFHHADQGYVMLTFWIPDEPCMLPLTATHHIGVGGFVINDNKEVLVVKEKKCPLRCLGKWKLPTGHVDKSEEIFSGAIREVKEETGIETTFLEVIGFRHAHNVIFEKSDLFFVCMMKPLSFDITIDESEIEAAKWMPFDEFLAQQFNQEDIMLKTILNLCVSSYKNDYHGFTAQQMISKFDDRLSYLYYGEEKNEERKGL